MFEGSTHSSCPAPDRRLSNLTLGEAEMRVTRLTDAPIITPGLHPSIGKNIQGPSLIRVPDWVNEPLGTYYL